MSTNIESLTRDPNSHNRQSQKAGPRDDRLREDGSRGHGPRDGSAMDRRITRRTPTWLKPAALVLTGCALAVAAWAAFWPEDGRRLRVGSEQLTVATVEAGVFEDFIPVRGRVAPRGTLFLDAVEGGRVDAIEVEDGTLVSPGQVLVRLSNAQLQLDVIARESEVAQQLNNLNTLELQLEQNRLGHRRTLVELDYQLALLERRVADGQRLIADGFFSQRELDEARDEMAYLRELRKVTLEAQATDERLQEAQMAQLREATEQLRRNLALARENLEHLVVRAPRAGQLTAFDVEVGQSLSRGERIGRIDDPDRYKLAALIDEFYLPRVDTGLSATVEAGGERFGLRVQKVYPQVTNGQFEVDLVFTEATPSGIRRGQTLQTRLELGSPSEALLIPNGAFYQDTGGQWVFVVTPDGSEAVRRTVRLGRRNARAIEVIDGLEPGERVIVSPYTSFTEVDRIVFGS